MTRQARALDVLLTEVDKHAPNRSKTSDGGLGDQAHAARKSDHNPNAAGVWRARDFTHDPKHLPGGELAKLLKELLGKHPAMNSGAYIIWNRRIVSYDRLAEGWRPYTGADPHTGHVHLSVSTAAAGYDSTRAWNLFTPKPTRVSKACDYLEAALPHRSPADQAKIRTALGILRPIA